MERASQIGKFSDRDKIWDMVVVGGGATGLGVAVGNARPECKDCWAKLYCSGGCAANAYHATGSITGVYEYGCELFKKRVECAIMIKVAENQELAAQGIEVPIELGGTCNACADGEACE